MQGEKKTAYLLMRSKLPDFFLSDWMNPLKVATFFSFVFKGQVWALKHVRHKKEQKSSP